MDEALQLIDSGELIGEQVASLRKDVVSEESTTLANTIYEHLWRLIQEAGKVDKCYRVTELLKVGSYQERTKIHYPDEFDFIAILEQMSEPDMVTLEKLDDDGVNVHLRFDHDRVKLIEPNVNWSWERKPPYGQLLERYMSNLVKILMKNVKTPLYVTLTETFYQADYIQLPSMNGIDLSVRYLESGVPNMIFEFLYKGRKIPVDITLGFRYRNWSDCYDPKEAPIQEIGNYVTERGAVMFVVHRYGFRMTFTETEVAYVRNIMLDDHKSFYMYLKYFNGKYGEHDFLKKAGYLPFSSYMLKTLCIYHNYRCMKGLSKGKSCLRDIVDITEESISNGYLRPSETVKGTQVGYLPSIFQIKKNLYREESRPVDLLNAFRKRMIGDIKKLHLTGRKWSNLKAMLEDVHKVICETSDWICSQTWSDANSLLLVKPE